MSRSRWERRCEASRRPLAPGPIARALADAVDRATARERSTPRCRRTPPPLAASRLVVNAIVFDRYAPRLAVPDGDRPGGLRLEYDLTDRVSNQVGNTAPRPRCGLAQSIK